MPGATSMVLPTSGRSGNGKCRVEAGAAAVKSWSPRAARRRSGLGRFDLGLMGPDHLGHAGEAEVAACARHGRRVALLPAIDPGRGEAELGRGRVVVEQALRGVQDVALLHSSSREPVEHKAEVGGVWLVGADVL